MPFAVVTQLWLTTGKYIVCFLVILQVQNGRLFVAFLKLLVFLLF